MNRNLYEDVLSFGKHIGHIHIKDKNNEKKNVKLGNGIVDFKKFFNCLKKINYNGNITLETPREKNFIQSAKNNYKFVKKFITEKHNSSLFINLFMIMNCGGRSRTRTWDHSVMSGGL